MKRITYTTEKRINGIKKIQHKTVYEDVAVYVWDEIFSRNGYYGATLRELEGYLGEKLENRIQINVPKYLENYGIFGIEYATHGNVRYCGTHDLHHVNVEDFNGFVRSITKQEV